MLRKLDYLPSQFSGRADRPSRLGRHTLACRERTARCPATRSGRRLAAFLALMLIVLPALPVFAADQDPAGVVGRTTNFLLNLLMGVGICFIAFGVLSLAMAFQSHDDSQKSRAVMAIMGGAIAVSVRYVIQIVVPNAGISI